MLASTATVAALPSCVAAFALALTIATLPPVSAAASDDEKDAAARVEKERVVNLATYEKSYLPARETLGSVAKGKWIAIVGGRIVPADESGRPKPAASIDECVRAAEEASPNALHRFVFQVGADGDDDLAVGGASSQDLVGAGLHRLLKSQVAWDYGAKTVSWKLPDGKTKAFRMSEDAMRFDLTLGVPVGRKSMTVAVVDSNVASVLVSLSEDSADALGLALFEMPGTARVTGYKMQGDARRALVRVIVPEIDVDELVHAVVWPRGPK